MLQRLREGLAWRWRKAARLRYLRKNFRNGDVLAQSYLAGIACDTVICSDGAVIRHPPGRTGLVGMLLEVWLDKVYTGAFYTPGPKDVVIDGGANIGLFSLLIARSQPSCQVFAFEPFPENYRLLCENLTAAGAANVQAFPYALSGESAEAVMTDGGQRSQDHRLTAAPLVGPASPAIRTCSLADALAMTGRDEVALFKCDIEGSEHDLIAAASSECLRRILRYAIEYHDNIRPGTLELLRTRLSPTHSIDVRPASGGGYGMLYAVANSARPHR